MCVLIENYNKIDSSTLNKRYSNLLEDEDFDDLTRYNTTDTKTVKERIDKVREYLIG